MLFDKKSGQDIRILIALLLVVCLSSFLIYSRINVLKLEMRIQALEKALTKGKDECETRIALIRAGIDKLSVSDDKQEKHKKDTQMPVFRLNLPNAKTHVLKEMSKALSLSPEQSEKTETVIGDYQKKSDEIFSSVKKGKEFSFGSFEYLDKLAQASQDAHTRLKEIMTPEQYRMMIKRNYDLRLGIRLPQDARQPEVSAGKHERGK